MMKLVGEKFNFKLKSRDPNTFNYEASWKSFKAEILKDDEIKENQVVKGLFVGNAQMAIRTTSNLDFTRQDRIMFNGNEYLVIGVVKELTSGVYILKARVNPDRVPTILVLE